MKSEKKSQEEIFFIHIYSQTVCEAKLIKAQDDCKEFRARLMAIDNCQDNPCQNGKCIDLENDYRCECQHGYGGKNCNQNCPVHNHNYRVVDGVCLL